MNIRIPKEDTSHRQHVKTCYLFAEIAVCRPSLTAQFWALSEVRRFQIWRQTEGRKAEGEKKKGKNWKRSELGGTKKKIQVSESKQGQLLRMTEGQEGVRLILHLESSALDSDGCKMVHKAKSDKWSDWRFFSCSLMHVMKRTRGLRGSNYSSY